MSFLTYEGALSSFSKAVFSLWFRVPMKSLVTCANNLDAAASTFDPANPPHLAPFGPWETLGIIPLITFGGPTTTPYIIVDDPVGLGSYSSLPDGTFSGTITAATTRVSGTVYRDPSYIGVRALNDGSGVKTGVVAAFQTDVTPVLTGYYEVTSAVQAGGNHVDAVAAAYSRPAAPDTYYILSPRVAAEDFADKWHHLLISVDLSNAVSSESDYDGSGLANVVGANKLWLAVDDVNYEGYDLSPTYLGGSDMNAVAPDAAYETAFISPPPFPAPGVDVRGGPTGTFTPAQTVSPSTLTAPITCTSDVPSVPMSNFSLPAPVELVDNILNVEMAEFQMYTGVSLDTSLEDNRRLFIDVKGGPVGAYIPDLPRAPALKATAALGVPPTVLFHGSKFWIGGISWGKPTAKFKPTGRILPFIPDPRLGK